ncbi:60S ribosomal protein L6, putative [Cryptosporidium muris RN66]|uniref:60S ribosomal protein L6, putative n=1 Tax=Cryptosporidium muris (strain RN66) TaxID=441375 RepID=B6AF17_CRYMR|nr:60S ribosomal protein L6, putative [Cryptosporidium muris RN66]EEA06784.1 60S ribosomal protein L6, putative [Cryptosporidium muris RN66]|eukprot:XP_002141133.1 60S ribosomal protein L6 [Cryptosporidium muris RN66]
MTTKIELSRPTPRLKITLKKKYASRRKSSVRAPKVRESLAPGVVCILLTGPYKGKRVVMLKTLTSGLIVVTGPFTLNGVPVRRVNPAYVIATSTNIDISGIDVSKFTDEYFKVDRNKLRKNRQVDDFMSQGENATHRVVSDERKKDQQALDAAILPNIQRDPLMVSYLKTRFTLKSGMFPHLLKF